ncbi:M3 family metallopeptidase [Capnocytophaga felis]|uniref:Peptidase M3 n=1 Tax=Capnocytophaga felis TaxID=2267611 RepID=A0A5M4B9W0_9FLAO|nr:M3 family metallopeptidase [Capnocytophaga felis]GET46035.1 peptidase M3 [Capnocytophaga felis]GET49113.1 peptidase M3 [Capnocytophaga felis]
MNKPIFATPYQSIPFSKYKVEDFKPAIEKAISESLKGIDKIVNSKTKPTFKNTIEALAFNGEKLDRLTMMFFNLNSAETSKELQKEAQSISPMLSDYGNDIRLNAKLFARVKEVYDNRGKLKLSPEQVTLLEKTYKGFTRNGANLSENQKQHLREIDKELSTLSLRFGENVLAETQAFELHIVDEKDLKGLPDFAIEAAAQMATDRNKKGWVFTLDFPSYSAFVKYAENRDLRRKMFVAYASRGFNKNANNNEQNILEIIKLRDERAKLLGYKNYASFILEERMADTPEIVNNFLNDLLKKAKPAAQRELDELKAFALKRDGITDFQKWDFTFYSEKLKQEKFNLDDEKLKPYFKLENVVNGMFQVANKLYGLKFKKIDTIEKYHEEVETYLVTDENGEYVSLFYTDFFPRPGKRAGAWMSSFKNQYKHNDENSRPHITIVCNFTRPTKTQPSLLSFYEVRTLFHEFGHALHGILADTIYPNLSGTSVSRDFVELPSQVLENWCYEKEALALFATHYQTNELIPIELVNKIKESSSFMEGLQTMRQLGFGIVDMAWHTADPQIIKSVKDFEDESVAVTELYPMISETCFSTGFSHIFQGGYAAGYYSYKWSEVLDADAFEVFSKNGIFDKNTAKSFKENILSKGGSEKPMELYKRFRGKEPSSDALLKRAGLM